jgi:hypothetical protein
MHMVQGTKTPRYTTLRYGRLHRSVQKPLCSPDVLTAGKTQTTLVLPIKPLPLRGTLHAHVAWVCIL